jgi:hypothetical protein
MDTSSEPLPRRSSTVAREGSCERQIAGEHAAGVLGPPGRSRFQPRAAVEEVADQLVALVATLDAVHAGLLEPPDIKDRQEGRLPYDVTTDVLTTIECVREDNLLPAIESLRRSAKVTDAERRQWCSDGEFRLGAFRQIRQQVAQAVLKQRTAPLEQALIVLAPPHCLRSAGSTV